MSKSLNTLANQYQTVIAPIGGAYIIPIKEKLSEQGISVLDNIRIKAIATGKLQEYGRASNVTSFTRG